MQLVVNVKYTKETAVGINTRYIIYCNILIYGNLMNATFVVDGFMKVKEIQLSHTTCTE